jgi:hypothetical protein
MHRTELLDLAVDAHGGRRRWEEISRFRVVASISGTIWAMKGKPGLLDNVVLEGETTGQRLKISPFPQAGRSATWEPGRETIEADDGVVVDERRDPATSFAGHTRQTPWDDFHVVYFASEANWNYFVAPFIFTRSDFITFEIQPWHEDGQVWRSLRVTYPHDIVAHCRQQTYYFDETGLLRRLDYAVGILGSGPAVHYPSEYREFDGIMVPTRRRVYVRNPDGSAARESVSIAIDVADVAFS